MIRRALLACALCLIALEAGAAIRIKDIVAVQGVRANQLVGYGLVIGLNGTGDSVVAAMASSDCVCSRR